MDLGQYASTGRDSSRIRALLATCALAHFLGDATVMGSWRSHPDCWPHCSADHLLLQVLMASPLFLMAITIFLMASTFTTLIP
eukprot:SAG31_NODE_16814_length_694_cov_2.673950_1_plen_82_part_01